MKIRLQLLSTIFFALFCCAFFPTALAQNHYWEQVVRDAEHRNFQEIVTDVEAFYEDRDKGKGSGYKDFKRWESDMIYYLNPDGTIPHFETLIWENYFEYVNRRERDRKRTGEEGVWEELGPFYYEIYGEGYSGGVGRIDEVVLDPDDEQIMYVGSRGGGLWKTIDNGSTWTNITEGFSFISYITGVAIDHFSPATNRTLYILVQEVGLLKSTDGGENWVSTGFTGEGNRVVMHPTDPDVLFITSSIQSNQGIHRSDDGGLTWTQLYNSDRCIYFAFKPDDPNIVYSSTNNAKFLRSEDSGLSWTVNTTDLNNVGGGSDLHLAVTPAAPNYVYLFSTAVDFNGGTHAAFFRSVDAGLTFTQRTNLPDPNNPDVNMLRQTFAVSSTDPAILHFGNIDAYRSLNGGESWEQTSWWVETSPEAGQGRYCHADIRNMIHVNGRLITGTDGGVFESENEALKFTDLSAGLKTAQIYRLSSDQQNAKKVAYGAQDNGSNILEQDIANQFFGADGMVCHIAPNIPSIIYYEFQFGGMRRSDNGGVSATNINPDPNSGAWVTPFDLAPNSDFGLAAGYADVHLSSDGGVNWEQISTDLAPRSTNCGVIDYAADKAVIYAAKSTAHNFYRGAYNGASWDWINVYLNGIPLGHIVTDAVSDPEDADRLWVTLNGLVDGEKVVYSEDGGQTWENISFDLPNVSMQCIVFDEETESSLYVGTDVGVFHFDAETNEWLPCDNGLPVVRVRDIDIQYNERKLRVATYGRGVWQSQLEDAPLDMNTSVEEISGQYIGSMQGLLKEIEGVGEANMIAYPNPFPTQSNIEFTVNQGASITLSVFDLKGTHVKDLVSESNVQAGRYRTTVNKQGLVNGQVYLCHLTVNGKLAGSVRVIPTE